MIEKATDVQLKQHSIPPQKRVSMQTRVQQILTEELAKLSRSNARPWRVGV